MSAGDGLKMLAAGLLLSRLVLHKPSAPEPVVIKITEPAPKPKPKWLGLTQNALATTVISVVLSGVVSYLVAHYQSEDSARQAVISQKVAVASQIEAKAEKFYLDANKAFGWRLTCYRTNTASCIAEKPDINTIFADEDSLDTELSDISNKSIHGLARNLINDAGILLDNTKPASDFVSYNLQLGDDYGKLVFSCGQLIQGNIQS